EAIIWCLESVYPQTTAQPDPEPSQPSPRCVEPKPGLAATDEPSPYGVTELRIAV
ncbi:hypothetical protein M9458_030005, partial [Cirrhinus mrigala]